MIKRLHIRSLNISIFIMLIFSTAILSSCSKDRLYLGIYDNNNMVGVVDTLSRIKIKPKVKLTKVQSRSDEYEIIPTGHHIHIYIYSSLLEPSTGSQWGYMGLYKMNRGTARPINDYITLPKGEYDLYALSIFNSRENIIPDIDASTGLSKYVYNGEDYLWGTTKGFKVDGSDSIDVNITMEHICARLNFKLKEYDEIVSISTAQLMCGDDSKSSFSLSTGMFRLNDEINSYTDCYTVDGVLSAIILPLKCNKSLSLLVDVDNDKYEIEIIPPVGKIYQGGFVYNYVIDLENRIARLDNEEVL